MSTYLPYIVNGITSGSIYAIAATGLVLTYKTSGIFNFAQGSVAAAAAYIFFELWRVQGMPWGFAAIIVVGVLGPLLGIALELLARRLALVSTAAKIVASVGLLVAIQALIIAQFGPASQDFPPFLPTGTFAVGGVRVGQDQLITVLIALASAGGLALFFRRSRMGTAMRAVVDAPELLDLTGISPARVRVTSWVIGSAYAALSGVLVAPTLGLDVFLLALLAVQAFGAAAVGSFNSLPMTYVGGLVIGVGAGLATKIAGDHQSFNGLAPSFPFIVLFVVLVASPARRLAAAGPEVRRPAPAPLPGLSPRLRVGLAASGLVVLALLPVLVGAHLPAYTDGLIVTLLFASLALLVRTSGQVSLCQIAFAAVGAATFSHLLHSGLPWLLALLLSGLVALPVGAVIAIPATRLPRLYLALATFGFGILTEQLLYKKSILFGALGVLPSPRPHFATTDRSYFYLVLVVVLAGLLVILLVSRSRLGRLLRGMADSPVALATAGLSVAVTRVLVFCISAFLAGISGALLASLNESVSTAGFSAFTSLALLPVLFIALVLTGQSLVVAPFVAAFLYVVSPVYINSPTFADYQPVAFGALAVLAAIAPTLPVARLAGWRRSAAQRAGHRGQALASRRSDHRPPRSELAAAGSVPRP